MRRFDKKFNITKTNKLFEERYLISKGLIKEEIETHSEKPNFGQVPVQRHPAVNVDFNVLKAGQVVVIGTEENEMSDKGKIISVTPETIIVKDTYGHTLNFNKNGECLENSNIKILTLAK